MKIRRLKWILLGLLVAACASRGLKPLLTRGPDAVTLHVEITNVSATGGTLFVSLFSAEKGFPGDPDFAERRVSVEPAAPQTSVVLEDVPTGVYAIAVLHDEDDDGAMATDFLGRPSEGWGASNDAKGRFGPPSFSDAAFELNDDPTTVRIALRH